MTPQQRNERIATEVLGWHYQEAPKKKTNDFIWIGWISDKGNHRHLPNFLTDESTMAMIVEGLLRLGYKVTLIPVGGRRNGTMCEIGGDDALSLHGDTPHAALIAAVEEMLKEGE